MLINPIQEEILKALYELRDKTRKEFHDRWMKRIDILYPITKEDK
jgi:hypothetical protein